MKRHILSITLLAVFSLQCLAFCGNVSAYWLWTPEAKKFFNPKNAVKDSPKEQYDWAMGFYNAKVYKQAAEEFEKVVLHYEDSQFAGESQFYAGLSYEEQGKYYIAFQKFQKVVDEYPNSPRIEETIEHQFSIGNTYLTKMHSKLLGADLLSPIDRAIEIFKKVVENAPFGALADKAQYRLGLAYKRAEQFEDAMAAFQKVVEEYPSSSLVGKARYEAATCAYKASLKPAYDTGSTEKAITAYNDFIQENKDDKELSQEADETVKILLDGIAEKSYTTASFYERRKQYKSALVYYEEIVEKYPQSSFAPTAKKKIEEMKKRTEASR